MTQHAVQRLRERFGYDADCSPGLVQLLRRLVLEGEAKFIRPLEKHHANEPLLCEWEVYLHHRHIRLVWCEEHKAVVTVYPPRRKGKREAA